MTDTNIDAKPKHQPIAFTLSFVGLFGGALVMAAQLAGGRGLQDALTTGIAGAIALIAMAYFAITLFDSRRLGAFVFGGLGFVLGLLLMGFYAGVLAAIAAMLFVQLVLWIHLRQFRARVPDYATSGEVAWYYGFRVICGAIFFFLMAPIMVMIPLSFNAQPFFTFTPEMLMLNPEGYSLRWYQDFLSSDSWMRSIRNSFIIGIASTALATTLGTLAALGLSRSEMPFKGAIMALLISPMIVPLIISAAGMFFFFSSVNLAQTYIGVILAHTALGVPFVVITVTATLVGFDESLTRAAASLGASPTRTFFKITMPLILPGVISGALFAFITSFDEIVIVLFVAGVEQRTIPREMWSGIREQISPTILAVATILVLLSIALLTTVELLRRRSERIRGLSPG